MIGEHILMMEAISTVTFWSFFVNTGYVGCGAAIIIRPFYPDQTFNLTITNEQKLLLQSRE